MANTLCWLVWQRRGEWKTNELDEGLGGESLKRCASEEDQERLAMAVNVASLAGIGRAVYAALVETLRENDRQPPETTHRDHLLNSLKNTQSKHWRWMYRS